MHEQQLFEKLVSAYSADLYRYAFWLCKQRSLAEDLVQETFARAWKSIAQLKSEEAAKSWLITILRRENARLYEKVQPTLLEIDDDLLVDEHHIADPLPQVEQQQLQQCIQALPLEYREPLVLQVMWGYSGLEIADLLSLKLATVNTRLFRARQQLKEMMVNGVPVERDDATQQRRVVPFVAKEGGR